MGLSERLKRLRAQAGADGAGPGGREVAAGVADPAAPGCAATSEAADPAPRSPDMPGPPSTPVAGPASAPPPPLAERLRRLAAGPARVRDTARSARAPDERALAESLGAEVLAPGVLRLTRAVSPLLRHGSARLGVAWEPRDLPLPGGPPGCEPSCDPGSDPGSEPQASPSGDPPPAPAPPPWLCLDTETSGLAGGTGTWAFLTGLLRWEPDGDAGASPPPLPPLGPALAPGGGSGRWRLDQILLTRLDAEPVYLEAVAAALAPPVRLLTYNGRSFDIPLLATRFRLAARPDPLAGLPHMDLLAPVRRAFARTWPDCRLATAEARLLGLARPDDLPGAAAPAAWLGWLRGGQVEPLAAVLRHNRADLLTLAALLPVLDGVYRDPAGAYSERGVDVRAVAAAHLAARRPERARAILESARRDLDPAGLLDLARLYRRAGDWSRAVALWEPLAAAGDRDAQAALARWHEHRTRDLTRALAFAESLPEGEDRERRRARLAGKLARRSRNLPLAGL